LDVLTKRVFGGGMTFLCFWYTKTLAIENVDF